MKIKTNLGYGTAYEKALLFDYARHWVSKYKIKSILEYPANDLMGNNNEIFERVLGVENCDRLEKNKNTEQKYDMVWCFCEFDYEVNSEKLIQDMLGRGKYVLIITQNYLNLGVPIHRFWHILWRRKWDHGIIRKSSSRSVMKYVKGIYEIVENGAFDCPWFYFDIYETFFDIKKLLGKEKQGGEQEFTIERSFFEKMPPFIRSVICHHNYLIIKKE